MNQVGSIQLTINITKIVGTVVPRSRVEKEYRIEVKAICSDLDTVYTIQRLFEDLNILYEGRKLHTNSKYPQVKSTVKCSIIEQKEVLQNRRWETVEIVR